MYCRFYTLCVADDRQGGGQRVYVVFCFFTSSPAGVTEAPGRLRVMRVLGGCGTGGVVAAEDR